MTKVTQAKPVKHSVRIDGNPVNAYRKDGGDSCSGYYLSHPTDKRLFLVTQSSGMQLTLLKSNWTIEEIVETEE